MALSGWSDTVFVEHGSATALDDMAVGTVAFWAYTTSDTARQALFSKFNTGSARGLTLSENATPSTLDWQIVRATTSNTIVASLVNFPHYAINKWLFIAVTFDTVTAANNRFYIGDLRNLAAEPSAYTTQVAGSGQMNDDAGGNWRVGRHAVSTGRQFVGNIATQYVASTALSASDIRRLQKTGRSYDDGSLLIRTQYGLTSATATQADLTVKGNHGTVTGTPTLAAHVPPMVAPPNVLRYLVTFAAAAGGGVLAPRSLVIAQAVNRASTY